MKLTAPRSNSSRRDGYVIFAVLIVVVVLSLVAYRFAESMTGEYRAGVRSADVAQAKLAAVSGLHYAAAVLSDRETFTSELDGNPFDNPDIFRQVSIAQSPGGVNPPRTMYFDICLPSPDGGDEPRYGVVDEGGKLNINSLIALDQSSSTPGQLLHDALMKLSTIFPEMTEEVADAIVDWVDADDVPRAAGAESEHYKSLSNGYLAKNGPLNSLDELLLVRGVTPQLLYGGDRNRNGKQDEGESDATRGLSDYLTVYGRELNLDSTGTARIYLNGDDPDTLYKQLVTAVGDELATYVVASKLFTPTQISSTSGSSGASGAKSGGTSQRPTANATTEQLYAAVQTKIAATASSGARIRSLTDMMSTQIKLPRPPDAKEDDPDLVAVSPLADPAKRNALLPLLLDKATVRQAIEMVPRININTAPREVLVAIPGVTEAEADAIVAARDGLVPTDPGTTSGAWLITTDTLTAARYKAIEKYITGGTMVYRVQSVGYSADGRMTARMEAVIDTNRGAPRFLHVRDLSDLENPRGFTPTAPSQ